VSVRDRGGIDDNQVVAYDVAHAAAAVATARATLQYGALGDVEASIAAAFVADVVADLVGRVTGRETLWGVEPGWDAPAAAFLREQRDPAVVGYLRTPLMRILRSSPRWPALAKQMNLPEVG